MREAALLRFRLVSRRLARRGLDMAGRHPALRRAAAALLRPFPRLRTAVMRMATGPLRISPAAGSAAQTLAEREAAAALGPSAGLVFQQLRAAIRLHGG